MKLQPLVMSKLVIYEQQLTEVTLINQNRKKYVL